jgi:hypothetical protein
VRLVVKRETFFVNIVGFVTELGIIISNCSALTEDVSLLFEQHWWLAANNTNNTVPNQWDVNYWPVYNSESPLLMQVNQSKVFVAFTHLFVCFVLFVQVAAFVAVSPPSLCPPTRTSDTDAIVSMFRNANSCVCF